MDLKLFLLLGLFCVVRAQSDMRDKAMQAITTGQINRNHARYGRNFVLPPIDVVDMEPDRQLNEILNTIPGGEGDLMEPGMADGKWHLPLDKQLIKYLVSRKARST
ncbi:uncharacterized protein LOC119718768 [Patiria miniata]|uniref:Uncharacterized protein n=1 Tax=Patiria miniata TaxID=46514 RepID=A0A913YZE4_PATMI|nr:uncharacterized protein LOC119718768 [Patiria miniata]